VLSSLDKGDIELDMDAVVGDPQESASFSQDIAILISCSPKHR
jgi:hypothetical protein